MPTHAHLHRRGITDVKSERHRVRRNQISEVAAQARRTTGSTCIHSHGNSERPGNIAHGVTQRELDPFVPITGSKCQLGEGIRAYPRYRIGDTLGKQHLHRVIYVHGVQGNIYRDLLLRKGKPGEVYNIGSDNERNNKEITHMLLKILGKDESSIEYVKDRPGHDRRYGIDATKITDLGWTPDYPREKFEEGLHDTVHWYLQNTDWVDNLNKRKEEMNSWQESFLKK